MRSYAVRWRGPLRCRVNLRLLARSALLRQRLRLKKIKEKMTRSVWKGPFVEPSLIKRFISVSDNTSTQLKRSDVGETPVFRKVWSRRSTVVPQFVGCFTQIYNGRKWIGLKITEEMVGHKFGEFASTRIAGLARDRRMTISKTKTKLKAKTR